jgi:methanethiol S-methyltransferase
MIGLGLGTAAWCLFHSILALEGLKRRAGRYVSPAQYRLFYNLFSMATLVFPALLYFKADSTVLVRYGFPYSIVPGTLFFFCLIVLVYSFRNFAIQGFLGLKEERHNLVTTGIYKYSRHPMYVASIGLLWLRGLEARDLVVNTVFTAYLLVGAFIEEMRLIEAYGDVYRRYRKETSMFLPLKSRRKRGGGV